MEAREQIGTLGSDCSKRQEVWPTVVSVEVVG